MTQLVPARALRKRLFSQRTEKEQSALSIFFIQNLRVVPGWAKPGHIGDYFYPWQGIITVMRKASPRRKASKTISEIKYFLPKADSLADLICQHMGFL